MILQTSRHSHAHKALVEPGDQAVVRIDLERREGAGPPALEPERLGSGEEAAERGRVEAAVFPELRDREGPAHTPTLVAGRSYWPMRPSIRSRRRSA